MMYRKDPTSHRKSALCPETDPFVSVIREQENTGIYLYRFLTGSQLMRDLPSNCILFFKLTEVLSNGFRTVMQYFKSFTSIVAFSDSCLWLLDVLYVVYPGGINHHP